MVKEMKEMKEKAKILLADDRMANIIALEKVLADLDIEFIRANSGNEALEKTLRHEFALALIDVQMPGMDGFETVKLLRSVKKTQFLPVIFISAIYFENQYQIKGLETGAIDYITKPIIPEILRGKVNAFLEFHKYKKDLEIEIEQRKRLEGELRDILKEKEELLKEINHRTKNNMNVISSLITLRSMESDDPVAQEKLEDIVNRIHSMATIYDMLYQSDDITRIDARVYLESLGAQLGKSFASRNDKITLVTRVDQGIQIVTDKAISCGLIINELLTNALKYAFSPNTQGRIEVDMRLEEKGMVLLMVWDNGRGLPENIDLTNLKSFGLRLIQMHAQRMDGQLKIEGGSGTMVSLRFPL
jgi:two-component sensor histidine kinase